MRFTDFVKVGAVWLFTAWTLCGCSATMSKQKEAVLLNAADDACHEEIVETLKALTGLSRLKISSDAFTQNATLVLTNHPRHPFPAEDPLVGVIGSEKILKLYRDQKRCYIALLDENGQIRRSMPLHRCRCKSEDDR